MTNVELAVLQDTATTLKSMADALENAYTDNVGAMLMEIADSMTVASMQVELIALRKLTGKTSTYAVPNTPAMAYNETDEAYTRKGMQKGKPMA